VKIAILGGSFNPLHIGHAMLAETVVKELKYDKVLFIPTCIPPHKEIMDGATTLQRLDMVRAFCNSEKSASYELEDCEVKRGGVSYTCDTLAYLEEKYKGLHEGKFGLIMGEEIASEFEKWKNPEQIVSLADLIIVPRSSANHQSSAKSHKNTPTGSYKGDFNVGFNKETFKYPFVMLRDELIRLSSTEIRNRIAENKSFKYLVPPAVFDYIEENGIFTCKN